MLRDLERAPLGGLRPVLARQTSGRSRLAAWLPALAGVLLLLRADAAWRFVQHGGALARLADTPRFELEAIEGLRAADVEPHVADALRACPDSVTALEMRDEVLRASGALLLLRVQPRGAARTHGRPPFLPEDHALVHPA